MQDSQGEGESDPAGSASRRCRKNSPSVLSCIGKRTKDCFGFAFAITNRVKMMNLN